MKSFLLIPCAVLLLAAGCTQNAQEQAASAAEQASAAAGQAAAAGEQAAEAAGEAVAAMKAAFDVGQKVTIDGKMGCGHCSFHKTEDCAAAVQTADGQVYILDVGEDHELFTSRTDGKSVKVEGTIAEAGDPPHVTVTNYTIGS